MHKMLREFKAFAMQGNMLDLAVGIVLGIAFKAVIDALSTNVIGGFLGAIFGKPNVDALSWKVGKGEVGYGALLTALINFVLVALALFAVVKLLAMARIARIRAQGTRECPYCRSFIPVDASKCCTAPPRSLRTSSTTPPEKNTSKPSTDHDRDHGPGWRVASHQDTVCRPGMPRRPRTRPTVRHVVPGQRCLARSWSGPPAQRSR